MERRVGVGTVCVVGAIALLGLGIAGVGLKVVGWLGALLLSRWLLSPRRAVAEVRPAAVFGDNMVIQRGEKIPVWGRANSGESVAVSLGSSTASAQADADGKWRVTLDPLEAGGPYEMSVTGQNRVTFSNVLIGDVWVCSGQSNMEWPVAAALNPQEEIAAARHLRMRLMTVPRILSHTPKENADTSWVECHPQTVGNFSAVAYFFGRALHQELDIPIGLINTSWGGTAAEAWTSRKTLETTPECLPILERAYAPEDANGPSVLYNGMIAPLLPYAIRGAIWYQGESNVGRASQYRTLFPAMIQDWRQSWGQGDFPFLFVQLANFWERQTVPSESDWGELREAQLMTLALPNTGMAVAIDLGEAEDIHPKNKQDVGLRLALAALATVYGREIPHSGPIYERMEIEGSRIRLHFRHTNGGLMVKGSETLEGFAIAGESRRFVWAEARIDDDTVLVSSAQVTEPVAVRYGWHHNPLCNLYNRTGLPASPFRTDDWPGVTVNNR